MKKMIKQATLTLIGSAVLGAIFVGFMYCLGELMMLLGIA